MVWENSEKEVPPMRMRNHKHKCQKIQALFDFHSRELEITSCKEGLLTANKKSPSLHPSTFLGVQRFVSKGERETTKAWQSFYISVRVVSECRSSKEQKHSAEET